MAPYIFFVTTQNTQSIRKNSHCQVTHNFHNFAQHDQLAQVNSHLFKQIEPTILVSGHFELPTVF